MQTGQKWQLCAPLLRREEDQCRGGLDPEGAAASTASPRADEGEGEGRGRRLQFDLTVMLL